MHAPLQNELYKYMCIYIYTGDQLANAGKRGGKVRTNRCNYTSQIGRNLPIVTRRTLQRASWRWFVCLESSSASGMQRCLQIVRHWTLFSWNFNRTGGSRCTSLLCPDFPLNRDRFPPNSPSPGFEKFSLLCPASLSSTRGEEKSPPLLLCSLEKKI